MANGGVFAGIIFCVVFLGIFGILIYQFNLTPYVVSLNPATAQQKEIRDKLDAASLLVYDNAGSDNTTALGYDKFYSAGLPPGQFIEVWFQNDYASKTTAFPIGPRFELRHVQLNSIGPITWYSELDRIDFYNSSGKLGTFPQYSTIAYGVGRDELVANNDVATNETALTAKCDHIQTSIIISPTYSNESIGTAFDHRQLNYVFSYGVNATQTGMSLWTIVTQILTFQSPNLGIPGAGGTIVNFVISSFVWAVIGYLVYKLIAGLIPMISGGGGD